MKKILTSAMAMLLLAVVLALPVAATEGYEPDFDVTSEAAYLVNTDTNIVVYEKNSEEPLATASLTKLMTVLLMLQNYQDQLDTISVTAPGYIYDILFGKNASTADIMRGETHSLRSLLYAMLLPSANEAAYIVADYMGGGSVDTFVGMMNDEAKKLGCTNTTFTDPCGLDLGNVTCAKDAYLMLRAVMGYDAFVQAAAATEYDMGTNDRYTTPGSYIIRTTDRMIVSGTSYYRGYTCGGKTGSLEEWQNFAGWHNQDGETYISVVLHTPNATDEEGGKPALLETGKLMDWAFKTYKIATALDTTQPITEIPIAYSTQTDTLMLYPSNEMMTLLPKDGGALTDQTFDLPERVSAPIKQGDVVGTVTLSINGQELGTSELVAGSDVSRNQVMFTLAKVGEFFTGNYFRVVLILALIAIAVYSFLWVCAMVLDPGHRGRGGKGGGPAA